MAAKNQILKDLKRAYDIKLLANIEAVSETYIQLMTDTLNATLGDPDIMGDKAFSKEDLDLLAHKMNDKFQLYHRSIEQTDENDYYRVIMDKELKDIFGEDFIPYEQRYPFVPKIQYTI